MHSCLELNYVVFKEATSSVRDETINKSHSQIMFTPTMYMK